MPAPTPKLQAGRKTHPAPFLASGWESVGGTATWLWHTHKQATLTLSCAPPDSETCYLMAEVSALSADQSIQPQSITLSIDETQIGEWTIDASTIHDKLVQIPAALLRQAKPVTLTLTVQPSPGLSPTSGMRLHTLAFATDLKGYLDELQTGYDWVCGIRDELLDTIRRVIFFFDNIEEAHDKITQPLQTILRNPYVEARHETRLIFDDSYFRNNLPLLKEGRIHQAIRLWVAGLQQLLTLVIDAGNHATRHPGIRCWDQAGLNELLPPPLESTEDIAALRAKNTTLNNLEILLHKDRIDSVPPILYLDITNRCNFRCRMCYQSTSNFLRQNLINDHMAVILDMLPYLTEITVAGLGEPLLSKNLLSLAEKAHALDCATTIITNGSLIPANIHILKQFSTVSISFDGAEATTFETLRNRSNFNQIVNNIKKLRSAAPETTLAFSVVLSRANLDELAGIMRWAADVGVNAVNVTPLEHMPVFELKKSDLPLFHVQLAEAQSIADQAGTRLFVAIAEQNFSGANDTPRDKKALIDALSAMEPAVEQPLSLEALAQALGSTPFNYYPEPIVFMRPSWPPIAEQAKPKTDPPPAARSTFNIALELARLDEMINDRLMEIRTRPSQSLSVPYCLDPWKLSYVKSNGKSRLCCHTDFLVGDLGGHGYRESANSPTYRRIRQAMTGLEPLLPACKKCRAADRALGLESINDTCRAYGIPFTAVLNIQGDSSDAEQ